MKNYALKYALSAFTACACLPLAFAEGLDGFSYTNGYARGGFLTAPATRPDGGYSLGGSMQKFRLGNEMDQYFEVLLNKNGKSNDIDWGLHWMPVVANGDFSSAQIYLDASGFDFAPKLNFWVGQRYHRIQDVHIVDNWMMQDGDNYGAGIDKIDLGYGYLNVAVHSTESTNKLNSDAARHNKANRVNFQYRDLPVNPGGMLNFTLGIVSGKFQPLKNDGSSSSQGNSGVAVGILHKQALNTAGLENNLFIQFSSGHADIQGKFYNLSPDARTDLPGASQFRIADSLNWQAGTVGGQAIVGFHTVKFDNDYCSKQVGAARNCKTSDFSIGGRVSWGFARHLQLLGEIGLTQRKVDDQNSQSLNKFTIALALSPDSTFFNRPQVRLYVSTANWNDSAAEANRAGFASPTSGNKLRKDATWGGVQFETWF